MAMKTEENGLLMKACRPLIDDQRGFTLIEIVMALGIFILGFVSVLSLFVGGYKTQEAARGRMVESLIAENLFETLREPERLKLTPTTNLRDSLTGIAASVSSGVQDSVQFPGYCYLYTLTQYGVEAAAAEKDRLFVTIRVFDAKFRKLYEKDYSTLTAPEKESYDRNCTRYYTIIDMQFES